MQAVGAERGRLRAHTCDYSAVILALTWLRKWGTWLLVGVLLAAVGTMWLLLRAARKKAKAHALADSVISLGREADAAYARARGDAARERVGEIENEIGALERERDQVLADREEHHADTDEMDERDLADEFNRRLGRRPPGDAT